MIYTKNQSGSVASFVVVAIVLVGAIVGAVWYLNNQDSSWFKPSATEVAKNDKDQSKKDSDKSKEQASEAEKQAESQAKDKIANEDKSADKPEVSEPDDKADSQEATDSSDSGSQTAPDSTPSVSQNQPAANQGDLPETGSSSDFLASLIGLMAIIGSGYVYYHFGRK